MAAAAAGTGAETAAADAAEPALFVAHEHAVRPFLDLIDSLRSEGVSEDISLPQIAVVGDQSSGKSSVLQAISGIPFPRGTGLVTRCPTQLIMKKTRGAGATFEAEARMLRRGGDGKAREEGAPELLHTPEEVTEVIERLTARMTGAEENALSADSIVIQVRSPDVPDLTLIDLPGIVRTTVAGQQQSVIKEVNDMIQEYIARENTVILAVVPANQDLATVEILERAKSVDPFGERTIGVLTKADLVDHGAEHLVKHVLMNEVKPLSLGYVMVRNPSQQELDAGVSLADARQNEDVFFKTDRRYRDVKAHFGVQTLSTKLSQVLVALIKRALPTMRWELESQMQQTQTELQALGRDVPEDETSRRHALLRIVSEYCRIMYESMRGEYHDEMLTQYSETRLHAKYQEKYKMLRHAIASTKPGQDEGFIAEIEDQMVAMRGRQLPGFPNMQVFFGYMVRNVESWRPMVDACRMDISQATVRASAEIVSRLVPQYPALRTVLRDVTANLIESVNDQVHAKFDDIFTKEADPFTANENMLDVINTIRFKRFDMAVESCMKRVGEKPESMDAFAGFVKRELGNWYMGTHGVDQRGSAEEMRTLIQAYWNVASRRVIDNVCMSFEQDFATNLATELETQCFVFTTTSTNEDQERLFDEEPYTREKRKKLAEKKRRVTKAVQLLRKMAPDTVARDPNPPKSSVSYESTTLTTADGGMANPKEVQAAARAAATANAMSRRPHSIGPALTSSAPVDMLQTVAPGTMTGPPPPSGAAASASGAPPPPAAGAAGPGSSGNPPINAYHQQQQIYQQQKQEQYDQYQFDQQRQQQQTQQPPVSQPQVQPQHQQPRRSPTAPVGQTYSSSPLPPEPTPAQQARAQQQHQQHQQRQQASARTATTLPSAGPGAGGASYRRGPGQSSPPRTQAPPPDSDPFNVPATTTSSGPGRGSLSSRAGAASSNVAPRVSSSSSSTAASGSGGAASSASAGAAAGSSEWRSQLDLPDYGDRGFFDTKYDAGSGSGNSYAGGLFDDDPLGASGSSTKQNGEERK